MAAKYVSASFILLASIALATTNDIISDLSNAEGLGETKSAFFSYADDHYGGGDDYEDDYDDDYDHIRINLSFNTQDTTPDNYYDRNSYNEYTRSAEGSYDDAYEDDDEDDDGYNDHIRINLSFNTQDTTSGSYYDDEVTRNVEDNYYPQSNSEDELRYRYTRCHACYQYCSSRGAADYKCDGHYCYCIPAQQTYTNQNSQKMPGNSCHAYALQIVGRGLGSTCDAFCRTIGMGKLMGVCVYNQCTCEATQQNYYPTNDYSNYQQYNRYYRSV